MNIRSVVSSPWMIVVLVIIGWGPLFIAELVRQSRPDLDANYSPQAFGMAWMGITLLCSVLAVIVSVIHIIRLILRFILGRGSNDPRGGLHL
jgi:hypothetical protein